MGEAVFSSAIRTRSQKVKDEASNWDKALGDLVESIAGAVLIDTKLDHAIPSGNPHFDLRMRDYNVSNSNIMHIPATFVNNHGLAYPINEKMILQNRKGAWRVNISLCRIHMVFAEVAQALFERTMSKKEMSAGLNLWSDWK